MPRKGEACEAENYSESTNNNIRKGQEEDKDDEDDETE